MVFRPMASTNPASTDTKDVAGVIVFMLELSTL